MNLINYIFIALIFVLSAVILIEDIQKKKIKNKTIITGFILGAFAYLAFFILGKIEATYFEKIAVNVSAAVLVAYLFWYLGFWPAGDAKFFILLSFLMPLNFYWKSYFPFFPSFSLLINIFIANYLALILISGTYFFRDAKKNFKEIVNNFKSKKISWQLIKNFIFRLFFIAIFFYLFAWRRNSDKMSSIKFFFTFFIVWSTAAFIIEFYLRKTDQIKISVEEIREGMMLSPVTKKILLEKDNVYSVGKVRAEGLNADQASRLQEFFRGKRIGDIYIQKTLPFSPWMVLGALLCILTSDNLLNLIYQFAYRWI